MTNKSVTFSDQAAQLLPQHNATSPNEMCEMDMKCNVNTFYLTIFETKDKIIVAMVSKIWSHSTNCCAASWSGCVTWTGFTCLRFISSLIAVATCPRQHPQTDDLQVQLTSYR